MRINTIIFPFTRSSDGEKQLDEPHPGLFNLHHLKVEGWALTQPCAFPESLIRRKSSKKTNSVFILLPAYRQDKKLGKIEKIIWQMDLSCQRLGFWPSILLWPSSFS